MHTPKMKMASTLILFFLLSTVPQVFCLSESEASHRLTPTPWPHQFHAVLSTINNTAHQTVDFWYDWKNDRFLRITFDHLRPGHLSDPSFRLKWNNGTTFRYGKEKCQTSESSSGIIPPDFLKKAKYRGKERAPAALALCNVFVLENKEKGDFVYFEDIFTKTPVYWMDVDGSRSLVVRYMKGETLPEEKWQAPTECFSCEETNGGSSQKMPAGILSAEI